MNQHPVPKPEDNDGASPQTKGPAGQSESGATPEGAEETLHRSPTDDKQAETAVTLDGSQGSSEAFEPEETLFVAPESSSSAGVVDENPHTQVADPVEAARLAAEHLKKRSEPADELKPFGDYDLLSVIAKGGMGVVYKARQRKLNRVVAIKMILAGQLADGLDVARFYAEAEAAANLRHPNIVGIYEIGEVDGQHFFSMEYVEGDDLADYARKHPLDFRRIAEYVKQIAVAMQFAHERGILHRDLKPSNVLIDSSGQSLITDFGLAKRVEAHSQLTMTGTIVGTPSYMPPEQARGEIDKIDASSDVYSTGAILYELLTGVPPFRAANPFETIRQVLSTEPAAPSVVNSDIPRDLETICLKALEKEPAARYATEQELSDELGRFLAGEPILARPISRSARVWRWCRRNPVVASLTAATAVALILALVGTSVGYVRATIAKRESDQSFRDSRAAVDDLFTRVSEDDLLNTPGMQSLRHNLLQRALAYDQKFLLQRKNDPTVKDELGKTYFRIGYITGEIKSPSESLPWYQQALEIQQGLVAQSHTSDAVNGLGDTWNAIGVAHHKTGAMELAKVAFSKAIDARQQVIADNREDAENHRELANSWMNLGNLLGEMGELAAARDQLQNAQQIRRLQLDADEVNTKLRRDYAQCFYNIGRLEWRAADREPDAQQRAAFLAAADAGFESAEQQFSQLLAEDPHDLRNQWRSATCLRLRADLNATMLDESSAIPPVDGGPSPYQRVISGYQQSRSLLENLAIRNPDVLDYQASLANVLMNLGSLQQQYQKDDPALESLQAAANVLQEMVDGNPEAAEFRRDLAVTQCEFSMQLGIAGRVPEAIEQLQESQRLFRQLVDESSLEGDFAIELARADQISQYIQSLNAPPDPSP